MANLNLVNPLAAGFLTGAILYIPIGPNGILALSRIQRMGYQGMLPTAVGSIASCFSVALIGSFLVFSLNIDSRIGYLIDLTSAAVIIAFGCAFLRHSYTRGVWMKCSSSTQKLNFKKMLISAFLVGISNPKGIVGFPALLIALGDIDTPISSFRYAWTAALGAVASAAFWWTLFYILFKRISIKENPTILSNIIRFLSLTLVLLGTIKLIDAIVSGS